VGQVGGLRLELVQAGGKTRLGECYQQMPLRLLPPFHFPGEPAALLYLLNPTVGLLDGDAQLVNLHVGPGARAVVTGQSANRIHPALTGFATQQWRIRVEDGAHLVVLPGPAIPYRGCRYFQHVRIDLAAGACLAWGDAWFPGRYARAALSELYQFDQLIQELEVYRDGELIFRDRFAWKGPWDADTIRWHVGGSDTGSPRGGASLFLTGPVDVESGAREEVIERGVLPLASGDTCIRWTGRPSEVVRELVLTALGLAARWSGGRGAPPWLLASNNLGPTHWFSGLR
jgi:urease accessory protein